MSRQLARELAAERARAQRIAEYVLTPERYAAVYAIARDWAEELAQECGEGTLPVWHPRYAQACARVGDMPADAELCLAVAADAWERMRKIRRETA